MSWWAWYLLGLLAVAWLAKHKGRSAFWWLLVALVTIPLVSMLLLLVLPNRRPQLTVYAVVPPAVLRPGRSWPKL